VRLDRHLFGPDTRAASPVRLVRHGAPTSAAGRAAVNERVPEFALPERMNFCSSTSVSNLPASQRSHRLDARKKLLSQTGRPGIDYRHNGPRFGREGMLTNTPAALSLPGSGPVHFLRWSALTGSLDIPRIGKRSPA